MALGTENTTTRIHLADPTYTGFTSVAGYAATGIMLNTGAAFAYRAWRTVNTTTQVGLNAVALRASCTFWTRYTTTEVILNARATRTR